MNSRNEKIQEITEALHAGIQDLFQSERYKEYLKVMSRFSHYSANNCLLISMQRSDTYAVAGYKSWQTKFGRQVQKGATAITIIQPAPWKTKGTVTLTDEDGKAIIGADGQEVTAVVEKIIPSFKLGHVFAYEDTDGKPLPEIATILQGEVQDYEKIMEILCTVSPVPIQFEEFPGAANGYFHLVDNKIVVKSSLPELQKLKTTIHEIAHSILHKKDTGEDLNANQREREVEAESVAFTVCSYLGLDTSEYSFGYIGGWSKSWELKELQEKMEVIRKAANQIISGIERERLKQTMQNCAELSCKSGNGYFHIAKAEDGCYDYTLYNLGFQVVDGGRWENGEIPIDEAARRILTCHNQHAEFFTLCDTDFLLEAAEKAAAEKTEIQKMPHTQRVR